jgi:hypothetical protein
MVQIGLTAQIAVKFAGRFVKKAGLEKKQMLWESIGII